MKFGVLTCRVFLLIFSVTAASDDKNSISETYNLVNSTILAKPGCKSRCGELIVPYPFGISPNCSIGQDGFDIYCNTSSNPPRASLVNESYLWIKQISDSTVRTSNLVYGRCYFSNGTTISYSTGRRGNYTSLPYTFSQLNKFTVIGCDDYARLTPIAKWQRYYSSGGGCMAFCPNSDEVVPDDCSGNGCCQTSIPKEIVNNYAIDLFKMQDSYNTSNMRSLNPCTVVFLGDANAFKFKGLADLKDTKLKERIEDTVPVVLEWAIGNMNCSQAEKTPDFACQLNSKCVNSTRETGGYRCVCKEGYEGNPYLSPGCNDIDECNNKSNRPCHGNICTNTVGGYNCSCLPGYKGDATNKDGCQRIGGSFPVMIFSLALVFGLLAILFGVSGIFFGIRKRKQIKLRQKCFEENGGLLLKQKLKTLGTSDTLIIYSAEQLQKATDNYSQKRIIGQGGHGVVYRGIFSDNSIVAIKKSKVVNVTEVEQFINEVLILTQVTHPNVVKVLGCCLEEKVPVLVYEFISNKTLFYHIHHKSDDRIWLSWQTRLRVAAEATRALAYLHSQATMPIIHRDVKSSNILLDDNHTAKISDFGASRLISLDHDQVTTIVQGTVGYLDPEYLHTSKLTDKSDVYSFGVVLAELITCQKPLLGHETGEERNLATYFVKAVNENRLIEIVDPRLLVEGSLENLQSVGDLVNRCLNLHGNDRPTMKEVAEKLESFMKFKIHPSGKEQTHEEIQSSILEIEQCDHDEAPLIYSATEYDYYSCSHSSTTMSIQENNPR